MIMKRFELIEVVLQGGELTEEEQAELDNLLNDLVSGLPGTQSALEALKLEY